jgi:hypothetical protein
VALTRGALESGALARALEYAGGIGLGDRTMEAEQARRFGSRPGDIVFEVDARGTVTASRVYLVTDTLAGLAQVRGEWGRVTRHVDGTVAFESIAGGDAQALGHIGGSIGACQGSATDPGAVMVQFAGSDRGPESGARVPTFDAPVVAVAISRQGTCLRDARWAVRTDASDGWAARDDEHRAAVVIDRDDPRHSIHCEVRP